MNTNHTPGPWIASLTSSGIQGLIYAEKDGANIAVTYATQDAALIAAAPDMLKALQRLTHPAADDTDLENALEVIAKATEVQA